MTIWVGLVVCRTPVVMLWFWTAVGNCVLDVRQNGREWGFVRAVRVEDGKDCEKDVYDKGGYD